MLLENVVLSANVDGRCIQNQSLEADSLTKAVPAQNWPSAGWGWVCLKEDAGQDSCGQIGAGTVRVLVVNKIVAGARGLTGGSYLFCECRSVRGHVCERVCAWSVSGGANVNKTLAGSGTPPWVESP
jgi:hypothetical protein